MFGFAAPAELHVPLPPAPRHGTACPHASCDAKHSGGNSSGRLLSSLESARGKAAEPPAKALRRTRDDFPPNLTVHEPIFCRYSIAMSFPWAADNLNQYLALAQSFLQILP